MPKYTVTFIKQETYEVEAENHYEAEDMALEILNDDEYAFLGGPVHEIMIEEVKKDVDI